MPCGFINQNEGVLHLSKSHAEAKMRVPQIVTQAVVEKVVEHKGEQKVSFDITMISPIPRTWENSMQKWSNWNAINEVSVS